MKVCARFHFEDVEPGDRLFLGGSCQDDSPDVEVVVRGTYRSHNFGPVVRDDEGKEHWLNDYDIIREIKP